MSPQGIPSPDAQGASSDDILMKKLFDGDANALLEIYDRHSALVFTVASHVVRNFIRQKTFRKKSFCNCGESRNLSTLSGEPFALG
jgi:hypothetical protein